VSGLDPDPNALRDKANVECPSDVAQHVFFSNLAEIQRSVGRNQVVLDDTLALGLKGGPD
jgi:hypothetical protein